MHFLISTTKTEENSSEDEELDGLSWEETSHPGDKSLSVPSFYSKPTNAYYELSTLFIAFHLEGKFQNHMLHSRSILHLSNITSESRSFGQIGVPIFMATVNTFLLNSECTIFILKLDLLRALFNLWIKCCTIYKIGLVGKRLKMNIRLN